jgi:hypothetical protein
MRYKANAVRFWRGSIEFVRGLAILGVVIGVAFSVSVALNSLISAFLIAAIGACLVQFLQNRFAPIVFESDEWTPLSEARADVITSSLLMAASAFMLIVNGTGAHSGAIFKPLSVALAGYSLSVAAATLFSRRHLFANLDTQ